MRIVWASLFLIFTFCGAADGFDRISIDAALDDSSRTITGVLSVSLHLDPVPDDLRLRLFPNRFCAGGDNGIHIDSLFVNGVNLTSQGQQDNTDYYVPDLGAAGKSSTHEVTIYFRTIVSGIDDRFGYYNDQYVLETWFPMPAPWRDGDWLLEIYDDQAEPVADFFDFEVTIAHPDSLVCIAPGLLTADTAAGGLVSRFRLDEAHEFAVLLGRDYLLDSDTVDGITVKVFYREDDEYVVDTVHAAVQGTIDYMSDFVSEYPYDEFIAVVGGMKGGGLELPRMTWLERPGRVLPTRWYHTLVMHETIHQWFYGMIDSDQARYPWLDESLTEYFTEKVNSHICGDRVTFLQGYGLIAEYNTMHRMIGRAHADLTRIDLPTSAYDDYDYFGTVYCKGALVVKTLTGLMGLDRESQFWHEYAGTFRLRQPRPEDLFAIADRYLPSEPAGTAARLIGMNVPLDFAVISVTSEKQVRDTLAPVEGDRPEEAGFESKVHYMARHAQGLPITMRLLFADGTVLDTVLTPESGMHKMVLHGDTELVGAIIDPDNIYAVDMNLLNNSFIPGVSGGAGLRLFSGLTWLVELLFSAAWGW